jgi:vesicle-associated membrane protein-associated protein A
MKEDPPLSLKCKDKFLVQSTPIPQGMEPNDVVRNHLVAWDLVSYFFLPSLQWTAVTADKSIEVHEQKLKVVYLPGDDDTVRSPCLISVSTVLTLR